MIKNSFFIAAAVAGLFAASISAKAATCPVTGATTEDKASSGDKKEAAKEGDKGKEKSGCGGCGSEKK